MPDTPRPSAATMRSRVAIEIAAELVAAADQPYRQAKVLLRDQGAAPDSWPLVLFGSSTVEGVEAVACREASLAMINPAAMLTFAYRGLPPFARPLPVRLIGVIPSHDHILFAVRADTGLRVFEEIGTRRYPLRIAMRGQPNHCLHLMFAQIARAAGFSVEDLQSWGGAICKMGGVPRPDSVQFQALDRGEVDAIFDEGVSFWLDEALKRGMTILSLSNATLGRLEQAGFRRGVIPRARHPRLPGDVHTVDFSGWPIFVHEALPDALVTQICAALEARKALIPWEEAGPLPVERMCREAPDTPIDVPLHPAAECFWRQRRYLP
jgi:TRAP-type uncharacterized transport system substrate-binding protein